MNMNNRFDNLTFYRDLICNNILLSTYLHCPQLDCDCMQCSCCDQYDLMQPQITEKPAYRNCCMLNCWSVFNTGGGWRWVWIDKISICREHNGINQQNVPVNNTRPTTINNASMSHFNTFGKYSVVKENLFNVSIKHLHLPHLPLLLHSQQMSTK